jgi:hypothetical protein
LADYFSWIVYLTQLNFITETTLKKEGDGWLARLPDSNNVCPLGLLLRFSVVTPLVYYRGTTWNEIINSLQS